MAVQLLEALHGRFDFYRCRPYRDACRAIT